MPMCTVFMQVYIYFKGFVRMPDDDSVWIETRRYEGHLESKERFAIQRYLLIKGKKKNMQVLLHTFTYFST